MGKDNKTSSRHNPVSDQQEQSGKDSALKVMVKIIILFGVAAYLVFALVLRGERGQEKVCTGLDVIINDELNTGFINENEVREMLVAKKLFPEGRSLSEVDLEQLEKVLTASPYIDAALCYQTAEGRVTIQVTPRHPVLHVINDHGDDFYIDNFGETMPRGHHVIDLIVMTGNVPRAKAGKLYSQLGTRLEDDEFWNQQIEEIHVTSEGELELTPRIGQHLILLGDTSNIDDKLSRMRIFYEQGLNKAGWNRYKTISLKYANQVICTK
ncbi:MAG: cell division protein FtsQ/DivIB [Bacteroidaceae bacterium]|nr:cell division protein FtsQ/DivIB [Bacteroidaceae bacterium]